MAYVSYIFTVECLQLIVQCNIENVNILFSSSCQMASAT